ncbi:MAG TPA: DUF4159 domain-containing protein [Tepidisphaeraceae bacterium]|jgi:hypothetical protein
MIRHRFRSWVRTRVLAIAAGAGIGAAAASVPPATAAPPAAQPPATAPAKPGGAPPAAAKPPAKPPAGPVTAEQVQTAIERAQKWFLSKESSDGNWEMVPRPQHPKDEDNQVIDLKSRQWGGLSSLATYALLASGVDRREPKMQKAIDFLLHANITSTYGLGLSSQIADYLPADQTKEFVKRNEMLLLAGMYQPSKSVLQQPASWRKDIGFYSYWVGTDEMSTKATAPKELNARTIGSSQPKGHYDRSNSQYGVLGMWALAQADSEVPTLYWQIEDAAWRKAQLRDGGWNYTDGGENTDATASMTAAGIATLYITQDYTLNEDWGQCKGGVRNENIERGLAWMDRHIAQAMGGSLYTLYGIERIGTASGRKYFGTADWYKMGSERLVHTQQPDGSWKGEGLLDQLASTAFALVFLSRGRAPVLMNKLEYGTVKPGDPTPEPWDERPRDVANLARWVGHQNETYLNWQVVNLKVSPEELHDAPILYISGTKPLEFTKEEEDKLRAFVEQGGMILGNDDCGKGAFARSFQALGRKLFPNYKWQPTPLNDFFYTEQFKKFREKPRVVELSNGVRKLMALIPEADPARAWQASASSTREDLFGLADNIFLYAVDKKNMLTKGQSFVVRPDPKVPTFKSVKVARLDAGENWNPEPGGWPRMVGVMRNAHKVDVQFDAIKPEAISNAYKAANLTGTGKLTLTPAARMAIKRFVEGGGTLIVDAAGGDVTFADSAQNELTAAFGESKKLELLAPEHPVYREPGVPIDHVGWRSFALDKISDKRRAKLEGITFGKRVGVFFSRYDLSAGLVGQPVDGIYGYDPQTATNLMAAMLIYAENGGAAPPATSHPQAPGHPVAGKETEARVGK